jgi:hypothetical protein
MSSKFLDILNSPNEAPCGLTGLSFPIGVQHTDANTFSRDRLVALGKFEKSVSVATGYRHMSTL